MSAAPAGGCACGKVRYRLASAPLYVHCCHCTECQRLSGSAFAVNAPIETDRIELVAGDPSRSAAPAASGRSHALLRCADCGVALWGHHPALGERIAFLRVGTLDEPAAFPPDLHCFTNSKLRWVGVPETARSTEHGYDPQQRWPQTSLARLRAALARPCSED